MQQLLAIIAAEQPRIKATLEAETAALHPMVHPVVAHILSAGGKRLRPILVILLARLLGHEEGPDSCEESVELLSTKSVYPLACSLELLHSATLLHDDILDISDLRRGKPTAHKLFGEANTILAGDALMALAIKVAARYATPALSNAIADAILQTASGEIAEIAHMRSVSHDYDTYLDIIKGKTAWMLQASCEMGALFAGATKEQQEAAATFGLELGLAFQIVDDALDFAERTKTGKPIGGDLREGKLTPPITMYRDLLEHKSAAEHFGFAMSSYGSLADFDASFTQGTFTEEQIALISQDMRDFGFVDATRAMAGEHLERARLALASLPDKPERTILGELLLYVQMRNV
ncbi:MAG: polyprenyl synthetase family protein [Pseudomonadota bacterium]